MLHPRKRLRAPFINYREAAMYFVTICLQDRSPTLATVDHDGRLALTPIGMMVDDVWNGIPHAFPDVELDAMIVMPDHVHGIFVTGQLSPAGSTTGYADVLRWFKSVTTSRYSAGVHTHRWPRYSERWWQRGSFDHVIRNEADLMEKRLYIDSNPWRFAEKLRNRSGTL